MFGQLPKLFDRDFAIGYFLPFAVFVVIGLQVFSAFGIDFRFHDALASDLIVGTTVIALVSWLGAILLLAVNRQLYRFMEGYYFWNPARLMGWIQRLRFHSLHDRIKKLDAEYLLCIRQKTAFAPEKVKKRDKLLLEAAQSFPDAASWLLPTAFGNTIRAFEVYSRVMYGMEAIEGWMRVLAVLPKEYRVMIDAAKAQADLWVNFFVLSLAVFFQSAVLSIYTRQVNYGWIPLVALVFAILSARLARGAAAQWGELVKSAFDIYLPKLWKLFGFAPAANIKEERETWARFSQAVLYRLPSSMPDRSAETNAETDKDKSRPHNVRIDIGWPEHGKDEADAH